MSANWQYIICQMTLIQEGSEMAQAQPNPASFIAGPAPVADLADPATRERLTPAAVDAMVRLADIWRLTSPEICQLLGDVSERTWFRMKKGAWTGALSQDVLTRVSALVGIFKGLHLLLSTPLADEWVRLANKGPLFGGQRPLDTMIKGGIPSMLEVRRYIDALRGGL
jgi:Antitoxin Xre/MbcA/ParS C-terminal toxin-binding domain